VQEFLLALPVLLFSVVAHEYAHGYAALQQGDTTAYDAGRLTLNPLKHIDPWMTILLPAILWFGSGGQFVFGGAKPVPVSPQKYRNYVKGDIIVSSAGIVTNLALYAACLAAAIGLGVTGRMLPGLGGVLGWLQRMMFWGIWLNALLAVFNLIPIPPLDGSHILYHLLPARLATSYRKVARNGFLILLALLVFFREVFFVLLMPAWVLVRMAFSLAAPFALRPLPF
jgi:Zn-dependent protease